MKNEDQRLRKLGQRIQRLRRQLNVSQGEFAKTIHKTSAHLSKIERGIKTPSLELLFRIADNLQVPVQSLFDDIGVADLASIKGVRDRLNALLSATTPRKARLILKLAQQVQSSEQP